MKVVVDANVVFKVFGEPAVSSVLGVRLKRMELLAPAFLAVEFHQIIWKARRFSGMDKRNAGHALHGFAVFPIQFFPDIDLLPSALEIAEKTRLTVYDSLYAALAQREQAALATFDKKLRDALPGLGISAVNLV